METKRLASASTAAASLHATDAHNLHSSANDYGIVRLALAPARGSGDASYPEDDTELRITNLTGCYELALAWAKPYLDLEFVILGSVLGQGRTHGQAPTNMPRLPAPLASRVSHVVCIFNRFARGRALIPGVALVLL